jgi:putative ABC transport system substrate-binding protein
MPALGQASVGKEVCHAGRCDYGYRAKMNWELAALMVLTTGPGATSPAYRSWPPSLDMNALEMLKEAVPQATRIGVLWNPTTPSQVPALQAVKAAGEKLGLALQLVSAVSVEEFDGALASMARERVGGVFVVPPPLTLMERARLAQFAMSYRLPTMFAAWENVEAGGLMSYGVDRDDLVRRAAL